MSIREPRRVARNHREALQKVTVDEEKLIAPQFQYLITARWPSAWKLEACLLLVLTKLRHKTKESVLDASQPWRKSESWKKTK